MIVDRDKDNLFGIDMDLDGDKDIIDDILITKRVEEDMYGSESDMDIDGDGWGSDSGEMDF